MSFIRSNFINGRNLLNTTAIETLVSAPYIGDNLAVAIHFYGSDTDTIAQIAVSGYFNELAITDPQPEDFSLPLIRAGDFILLKGSDNTASGIFTQTTVPYEIGLPM